MVGSWLIRCFENKIEKKKAEVQILEKIPQSRVLITREFFFIFPDQQSPQPQSWSKKLTKSTENCYNIQEGRVIERGLKGRYISPIRLKNKNNSSVRSTSPAAQSITSIRTISTSTPTHQSLLSLNYDSNNKNDSPGNHSQTLNWRILQRDKLAADAFDADKSETRTDDDSERDRLRLRKNDFSRTVGGYSVPYREKRNPLSSTRLSCYKPIPDKKFDISNLKNYKSVDDFLSLDKSDSLELNDAEIVIESLPFISSTKDLRMDSQEEEGKKTPKMEGCNTIQRMKKAGLSSKLRSMSDKTHKLFSKFYSNSNMKLSNSSSSDVCNDFILHRTVKPPSTSNVINSRRSLSYGTLPGINEFEIKKIETEDGDSGILVNESGASSMVETDSSSDDAKTEIEVIYNPPKTENCEISSSESRWEFFKLFIWGNSLLIDNFFHPRTNSQVDEESRNQPKNGIFDLAACRHSSSSDQILTSTSTLSFISRRSRNLSMDGLDEKSRKDEVTPKRNSIVSEIVAMWVELTLKFLISTANKNFFVPLKDREERDEVQYVEESATIETANSDKIWNFPNRVVHDEYLKSLWWRQIEA